MDPKPETILVVDDNEADRALISALIGGKYRVVEAADAERGLALHRVEKPGCVLLDHQMPGMPGLEAIRRFVAENAVVVMLTGAGNDELAAAAFKRGARDYVRKSGLNRAMLERILSRELERRRLELDLEAAQVELRLAQKLEAIGQLAAGVAHEINTPAQYVSDNLTFLADGFAQLLPFLEACSAALDGTDGAAGRIQDLRGCAAEAELAFFLEEAPAAIRQASDGMSQIKKIVAAMKELSHPRDDMQPTDLNHVLSNTLTVARSEWKHVADVELDLAEELPLVVCSPSEINQVALNLLVNAAQAVEEGAQSGRKGEIRIRTRCEDGDAVITIEDTGCGIPAAIRDRIFDPFFTTKPVGKGTGQGLAIVHRIVVEHHGGSIDVHSRPGAGTCFVIRLPVGGRAEAGPPPSSEAAAPAEAVR